METETKKSGKEKMKEIWEKIKTAVGKVSKLVWIIVAVAIVAIVVGIIVYLNTRPYSILVTGASPSEVTTVTTWLENRGIQDYRVQGNNTVLVPDRQAAALKAALLNESYSDGDYDHSYYFDNVGMLSTESERNNAWKLDVEQSMSAIFSQMEGVEWAQVSIAPGEDRGFVLDSANVVNATASVMVQTRNGEVLDQNVVRAMRNYLSHGVQGLKIESVVVEDTNGNPYEEIEMPEDVDADSSLLKFQLEQEQRNKIRTEIMKFLTPLFGKENVGAGVNVTVDVSRTEVNEEGEYIPDYVDDEHRGAGQGIISQEIYNHTTSVADLGLVGGLVGAERNSDIPVYTEPGTTDGDPDREINLSGQTNYNNPTRTTHKINTAAYIADVHIAVSINSRVADDLNLELLREGVANAAGIVALETDTMTAAEYLRSKVTIYSGPFYQVPTDIVDPWGWWPFGDIVPGWVVLVAAVGLVLFLILLIILIVALRSRKKKKEAAAALAAEEAAAAAAAAELAALEESEDERREAEAALAEVMGMPQTELVGADVMSLQTEKSMELRQDIRQFVEENPEVAAQLLKSWLRGGDDRG